MIDFEKSLTNQKVELIEIDMKPMSLEILYSDINKSIEDVLNQRLISAEDLIIKY